VAIFIPNHLNQPLSLQGKKGKQRRMQGQERGKRRGIQGDIGMDRGEGRE